ncbi:hypothetical protein C0J52_15513 [Blattella germanica]|nr:hypothetical protein C0J52_15513 [Blattella germanica]
MQISVLSSVISQYFPFFVLIGADFLRPDDNGHSGTLNKHINTQLNLQSSPNCLIPLAHEWNAATIEERHMRETNELTLK